jgi:branched-chain amino acid aminotransferase
MILVHDGHEIVPAEEARIPVLDHGFLFGDSVYDVIRSANRRPFMMAEHLDRLRASGALIYLDLPWSDDEIAARIALLHEKLGDVEAYFRIVATRGPGPLALVPTGCDDPGLYIIARELMTYPEALYSEGCSVRVVSRQRNSQQALDPRAKTGNYLNNMLGLVEAQRDGADDALFLNADGDLTEATTSNLWVVEGQRVVTPPLGAGLLAGITRDWLFATSETVTEETVSRDRLVAADEVFLTGTVKGVMPVTRVDGESVGSGVPGWVTRRIADRYDAALGSN